MRASEELLADFARTGSERSFSELVARHVDLVYATALRTANGDKHLAQDISQMVFADLVRKAGELEPGTIVPGWLYRHTRFTAAKVIRGEKRRQIREVQAVQQIDMCSEPEEDWLNGALDVAL